MNGHIRLHRKFIEWEWFNDSKTVQLFIYLLLKASWKDVSWKGTIIKRGQIVCSYDSIRKGTGLTIKEIRTRLIRLERTREIGREKGSQYTTITILKYGTYQVGGDGGGSLLGRPGAGEGQHLKKYKKLIEDIVEYLNKKTNKSYKHQTKATQISVAARLNQGYTLDDFKKVIDVKVAEWLNTDMDQYLRPDTLFGTKFENYVNQNMPAIKEKPTASRGIR